MGGENPFHTAVLIPDQYGVQRGYAICPCSFLFMRPVESTEFRYDVNWSTLSFSLPPMCRPLHILVLQAAAVQLTGAVLLARALCSCYSVYRVR